MIKEKEDEHVKKRMLALLVCLGMLLCIPLAVAGAQGTAQTYLALGDSITTGEGLGEDELSFAQMVAEGHSYILDDTLAKNGATTLDVLNSLAEPANAAKLAQADVITLTVGGNDLMGALYSYLTAQYNAQPGVETELSVEEMQEKLMNADLMTLAFALGVLPDFAQSAEAAEALQSFSTQFGQIVAGVKAANPDVVLIVANQYNPYSHTGAGLTGQQAVWAGILSSSFEAGVTALNAAIQLVSTQTGCLVADAYSVFAAAGENPCNATFATSPINLDFHPNAYGHTLLAEAVETVLPMEQPEQTEGVNVGGLALISDGVPVYAVTSSLGKVTAATEGDSWNVKYDGQTLTLKDATVLGGNYGVRSYGGLTLELVGDNKVGTLGGGELVYGVYVDGNLTIQGSGSLSAAAAKVSWEDGSSYGMYTVGDLTVTGGSISVLGGAGDYSFGIYTGGSLTVEAPAQVSAVGGASVLDSIGICAKDGTLTISGGTVNAAGGSCIGEYWGISSGLYTIHGDTVISGGTVVATGEVADYWSTGIRSGAKLVVTGGSITASAVGTDDSSSSNFGIYSYNQVEITGTPTIYASCDDENQVGIYVYDGDITLNGEKQILDSGVLNIQEGKVISGIRTNRILVVNGVDVLTAENYTVACGDGAAVYDPESGVLTLTDAVIDTPFREPDSRWANYAGIYSDLETPVIIALRGQNSIVTSGLYHGVRTMGDLIIRGDGALEIFEQNDPMVAINTGGNLTLEGGELALDVTYYGVYVEGRLNITGGKLDINCGGDSYTDRCLYICNGMSMSGGVVTLQYGVSSAIYMEKGGLEISGGELRGLSEEVDPSGISMMRDGCSITGGIVDFAGSFSIYNIDECETALSVTGGELKVTARRLGLNIFYGTLSIGGDANVTAVTVEEGGLSGYAPEIQVNGVSGYLADSALLEVKDGQIVSGLHLSTVFVNGTDLLLAENHTVACGGGTAVYDPEAGVLTLKDAEITTGYTFNNTKFKTVSGGIVSDGNLTLVLEGSSTISGGLYYGVYSKNALTVQGDGALTVTADGYGIAANRDLNLAGGTLIVRADGGLRNDPEDWLYEEYFAALASTGGTVKITGGSIEADAVGGEYRSVFAYYNVSITGGTLNASLTLPADQESTRCAALTAYNGNLSIQGGTVTITAQGESLFGIKGGNTNITGGTVTVTAEGANSAGIYLWSNNLLTISGAKTVVSVSGTSVGMEGNLTLNGGTATVTATDGVALNLYTGGLELKTDAKLTLSGPVAICLMDGEHNVAVEEVLRLPKGSLPDGYELSKLTAANESGEDVYIYTVSKTGEEPSYDAATGSLTGAATELTIYVAGGSSSGGSYGGSGNKTETTTNPDGSTTTTVTKPDGTVTETTNCPDGSSSSTVTAGETSASETQVSLSQERLDSTQSNTVSLPMSAVTAAAESEKAPTVTVKLPSSEAAQVEIPVAGVTAGTVAVLVKEDGSETVIQTSLPTAQGVVLTAHDGDTFKIVDNSKTFTDVEATHWGADDVAFVSSRELFSGTSESTFSPELTMSRGMALTLLARFDGVDTSGGDTWYEVGRQWAMEEGISDGTNMDADLTREQLATMLCRYAQYKGYDVEAGESADLQNFPDGGETSDFAVSALQWACGAGIINGKGDGTLAPAGTATRVEAAAMFMRFCQWIAG